MKTNTEPMATPIACEHGQLARVCEICELKLELDAEREQSKGDGVKVKRTERGWAGHFICARDCLFRRNTLIESDREKIVVSTVGAYLPPNSREIKTIGAGGRYYETRAFKAKKVYGYWEIEAFNQIDFDSEWSICADSEKNLPICVDIEADKMHEKVVGEMIDKLNKEATPQRSRNDEH